MSSTIPPKKGAKQAAQQDEAADENFHQARRRHSGVEAVIGTLQDLGFVIDDANSNLGIISGTKLDGYLLRMMVTVKRRGEKPTTVCAPSSAGRW